MLEALSLEMQLSIRKHLDLQNLLKTSLVCKSWHRLAKNSLLWKHRLENDFSLSSSNSKVDVNFKLWYMTKFKLLRCDDPTYNELFYGMYTKRFINIQKVKTFFTIIVHDNDLLKSTHPMNILNLANAMPEYLDVLLQNKNIIEKLSTYISCRQFTNYSKEVLHKIYSLGALTILAHVLLKKLKNSDETLTKFIDNLIAVIKEKDQSPFLFSQSLNIYSLSENVSNTPSSMLF